MSPITAPIMLPPIYLYLVKIIRDIPREIYISTGEVGKLEEKFSVYTTR